MVIMTNMSTSTPPKASCHCGAVKIEVPSWPTEINDCQCTLCRRYGAAWTYFNPKDVEISIKDSSPTKAYIWGDKDLEFHFCSTCGCMCFWKAVKGGDEMGINTRLMEPDEIRTVNRRTSFGALSRPLREQNTAHPQDKAQYS